MILDGPMGRVADTLTRQFGRPATIQRPGAGGAYDPATGNITGGTGPTLIPCRVVFEEFGESQIDGTLVREGDRKALVARQAIGTEPEPGSDLLVEGGRTWQIIGVRGYSSGATEAAYSLHVRR